MKHPWSGSEMLLFFYGRDIGPIVASNPTKLLKTSDLTVNSDAAGSCYMIGP